MDLEGDFVDDMPLSRLNHYEKQLVEKIADNMRTYGISTTVGRVLGIIYMNRKPMTLNELSEATGMSKTRMSQVVREMVDLNIAEKVFEKGLRKDLYQVEQDYYQTFISIFSANWQKTVSKNRSFGKKITKELNDILKKNEHSPETEEKVSELLKEMKEWMNYYQWLNQLVHFFESGEVFKHVPKP